MTYLWILSLIFVNSLRLSFSMCLMSRCIKRWRSTSPSLVTSTTLLPPFSSTSTSLLSSNNDDLNRSNVGNLSTVAQSDASIVSLSCSSSSDAVELLRKLDACRRNDELRLLILLISGTSILTGSLSSIWSQFWRTVDQQLKKIVKYERQNEELNFIYLYVKGLDFNLRRVRMNLKITFI